MSERDERWPGKGGAIPEADRRVILGPDHYIDFVQGSDAGEWAGKIIGGIVYHRDPSSESRWCGGGVWWDGDHGVKWTLVSFEPLELSPSIRCNHCPDTGLSHGFIRAGRWEPAGPYEPIGPDG